MYQYTLKMPMTVSGVSMISKISRSIATLVSSMMNFKKEKKAKLLMKCVSSN